MTPLLTLLLAAPFAASLQAPTDSLADRMPASTVFLLSVPDLGKVQELQARSPLVRIVRDPEVHAFLGDLGEVSDDSLDVVRDVLAELGLPPEVVDFDAYRALEFGFAVQPLAEGQAAPDPDLPVALQGAARIATSDPAVASSLFDYLTDTLVAELPPGTEVSRADDGAGHRSLDLRSSDGATFRIALEGDTIWFDLRFGFPESTPGLDVAVSYGRLMEEVTAPDAVLYLFMDVGRVVDLVRKAVLPQIDDEPIRDLVADYFTEVLEPIGALALSSGWHEDGGFQHAFFGIRAADSPLYTLYRADPSLLRFVPAKSTTFGITGYDLGAWAGTHFRYLTRLLQLPIPADDMGSLGDGLAQEYPELHSWLLGEHRAELQAALEGLGRTQLMFGTSRIFGGEFVALERLDDPGALASVLEQLLPRLKQFLVETGEGDVLQMRRVRRVSVAADGSEVVEAGPAYFWLDLPADETQGMDAFMVQPCFGVSDDGWLVLGLQKDPVRRYLRDGVHPAEPSVLERADLADVLASIPDDAVAFSFNDVRPLVREALGMALPFVGFATQSGELPLEFGPLPSPEAFAGYFSPQVVVWQRVGDGLQTESHGYLVAADLFPMLRGSALAGAWFFDAYLQQAMYGPPPPPEEELEF